LTCTIVAEKFMNDDVYVNSHYAAVGGVCLREMNRLEIIVLHTLMWRLGVSPEEYNEKREDLRHSLADASSASRTKPDGGSWKEWIMVQEAVCETAREEVCEKKLSNSELSMQEAITISGSTVSGDTDFVSDSDSALMTISDIMDSPGVSWGDSGVSWGVAD
jgi:ADP-dependent phosphofructokinase/glucokinase